MNKQMPEITSLEEVIGQFDFVLQEGIIYTKAEKERALSLSYQLEKIIEDIYSK